MNAETDERMRTEVALLARRAGVTFSDDELADLAPKVLEDRAGLERLREAIRPDEEPAHTFAQQVGRDRS
jgi:hypothetical protein